MPKNPFRAGQNVDTIDVLNLSFGLTGLTDQFRIAAETYCLSFERRYKL